MPEIVVNFAPVPKARPRLGRGKVFTPRTTEVAEARIREAWIAQVGQEPLSGPLSLSITIALPRPRTHFGVRGLRPSSPKWPSKRPDWDNYAKTVSDALNGVAYHDDGQIVVAHVAKRYATEAPHWVIRVAQLPNEVVE